MSRTSLNWTTTINGRKKNATTHFGTTYTIEKIESLGGWRTLCVDSTFHGGVIIAQGVSYVAAVKAANDDYKTNGGR